MKDLANSSQQKVIIIGAGPAGLFAAYLLIKSGYRVEVYDQASGIGKKFLVAGHGGLNLTHSENLADFAGRYEKDRPFFEKLLHLFGPDDLRQWCHDLGVETFIGTSGRVFPTKLKSAEILFLWFDYLKASESFSIHLKHRLTDINLTTKEVSLENAQGENIKAQGNFIILALGGGSWKKTGSDGSWVELFKKKSLEIAPLLPMNCGFEREWSSYFQKEVDRLPLKNIALTSGDRSVRSEMMITPYGIEGSAVYALSNIIRDDLLKKGETTVYLDLVPALSLEEISARLNKKSKKKSLSQHLKNSLKLSRSHNILLKELVTDQQYSDLEELSHLIKKLPIKLTGIRPIDEAISTSGGICFEQLDDSLELKSHSGIFFVGEMLDFEAPTGGYLLQGCFSTAYAAVKKILV